MTTATVSDAVNTSAEVEEFAMDKGVSDLMPPVLATAAEAFPGRPISLYLEYDPEIAGLCQIMVDVDVNGWTVDQMVAADRQYSRVILQRCPAPRYGETFVLRLSSES